MDREKTPGNEKESVRIKKRGKRQNLKEME